MHSYSPGKAPHYKTDSLSRGSRRSITLINFPPWGYILLSRQEKFTFFKSAFFLLLTLPRGVLFNITVSYGFNSHSYENQAYLIGKETSKCISFQQARPGWWGLEISPPHPLIPQGPGSDEACASGHQGFLKHQCFLSASQSLISCPCVFLTLLIQKKKKEQEKA